MNGRLLPPLAEEVPPEPPLLPRTAAERARVRAMAQLVACEIHPLNNTRVLGYLEQELRVSEQARDRWYAHWVQEGFRGLEPMLGDAETGQFCHGDLLLNNVLLSPAGPVLSAGWIDAAVAPPMLSLSK